MTTSTIRNKLERHKGRRDQLRRELDACRDKEVQLEKDSKTIQKAQGIIQAVAQATQKELEYHISDLGSLALESVFQDPYRLGLSFGLRRNKSEADLYFYKEGEEERIDPLTSCGGGDADVASLALRISLLGLHRPGLRKTLVLDEPFKYLNDKTRTIHKKAAAMLKMVSEKLGLQIIVVTLLPEMIETADRVFEVSKKKGISKVEVVG